MNQTEIDELRRLASVSREPRHGIGCIASDCALASAARNAIPRLLAALEEARDERDRARQKIQAMEEQAMADEDGMSMRPLDGRLRKVEAERDALKATLAKRAESERAWCELARARGAKLAALVTACSTWREWGGHCDTCEFVRQRAANPILDTSLFADYCDCGWHATKAAIAAAKVQP